MKMQSMFLVVFEDFDKLLNANLKKRPLGN